MSVFNLSIPLSVVLAVTLFIFSDWISLTFFKNENLSLIIKIISVSLPFNAIREILFNSFKGFQNVKYEVYCKSIGENVSKIALTLVFFLFGFKLLGATIAYVLAIIISFVLAFYFLEKKLFSLFKIRLSKYSFNKELLVYSIPLLFGNFIFSLILWTDTLMIGYFLPESDVGIYNAAIPTAFLMFMIPYALLTLFLPILTELYSKDKKEDFKSVYKVITKWVFLLNLVLLSSFLLFSKEILGILFGNEYIIGASSLVVLAIGYFIGYTSSSGQSVLLVLKKTKLILFNTVIMAVGNIILNILLIPKYGILGAAIATASIFVIRFILVTIESIWITKIVPFSFNYIKLLFSIGVSSVLIFYISKLYSINILTLVLTLIFLVLVYGSLLLITKALEKEDVMILRAIQDKTGKDFSRLNRFLGRFVK